MDKRVNDGVDMYLSKVAPNRLKATTQKCTHSFLKRWRRELGPRTKLSDITTGKVLEIRDQAKQPATGNRWVAALSAMLDACAEREWVETNVCRRIKPLRVHNSDTGKLISREEEALMLTRAYDVDMNLYILIRMAFATGARLGELEGLTWDVVDLENRTCTFLDTKNGANRCIPLDTNTIALMQEQGLPSPMVRSRWRKIISVLPEHVRFHDIRHTMISRALARGIPITLLGKMVGHKTLAMTIRYHHAGVEDLRHIVEGM